MSFPLRIYNRTLREHRIQVVQIHSIKVGRAPTCDVVLDSNFVSSEHLLIRVLPDGAFSLQHVGHNPTTVDGKEVRSGQSVPIRPHEEIRVANFSLFIEGGEKEDQVELGAAESLAALELELHGALVERLDLREVSAMGDESIRTQRILGVLDDLVRERFSDLRTTKLRPELVEHALRESLYSEVLHELMSRSSPDAVQRARGFVRRLDADAASVVEEFLRRMGITGTRSSLRRDLRTVEQNFEGVFRLFTQTASDGLIVVLVQRFVSREVLNLICGRGPLQDLLELPDTSEIMVVHKDLIYVERAGRLQRLHRSFITDDILIGVIQRIVDPLNRKIDKSTPLVDARLPDGSRVNAVIPPLAVRGPCLTIRRFSKEPFPIEQLLELGALTPPAAAMLRACVAAHKNVIISGGTGSGKTTLLNILSGFISDDERIVTIEDSAELQLRQEHVVTLEARPANAEGRGAYSIRDLVRNALRMRPDRVIVGECRGGEALDMLQAMNTGHDGSLTTIHANNPEDALRRLEILVLEAVELPVRAIREQIAAAIHVVVQTQRLPSGKRMVTHISEVVGLDDVEGTLQVEDIFEQAGGTLRFSGTLPSFIQRMVDENLIELSALFPAAGSTPR